MNTTLNALFPQLENLRTTLDPFTVGYDKLFGDISDMTKDLAKKVTYPPYNIKQVNKNKYVIEMAVAGFAKTDIEVTLEGNKLVIRGATVESDEDINKHLANKILHDEIVDVCQSILKELNSRTFQLRDFIAWERFIQGV